MSKFLKFQFYNYRFFFLFLSIILSYFVRYENINIIKIDYLNLIVLQLRL